MMYKAFVIGLHFSTLFVLSVPSEFCVYKLKNGKLVPSKGCTEPDHGTIISELKARIQAKAAKTKARDETVTEPIADEVTFHDAFTGSTATTSTNTVINDASKTLPPATTLMLNQTTDFKEVLETASPTTTSPPLSQDIHILIGRRSSLSVISILSTSGVSYEQYGINVTDLIAIDYDPVEKYIYWTGKGYIRRAKTNFTVGELLASNLSTEVDGVAVDWVARNMYWSDKGLKLIGVSRLDGSSKKNFITTNIEAPRAIVLYPAIGKMYWSDWGSKPKIEATSLDGTDRHILVNGSLMWPNGLAIDYARNFLYWVDAGLDRIEAIQLDGSGRTVLIAHDHHIFGFTYFQNFIYWTDWQTGSLDRMLVYNSTIRQNIASGAGDFMGVKVYGNHAIPQTNQCYGNNNGCSHLCFYTSNGAVCDCPQSWGLKSDKKTCISP